MLAFFDSGSEINAINLTLVRELGLFIKPIDIGSQKIDKTMLDIFEIMVTAFSVNDKANQLKFFEEIFLGVNVSLEVVLGMLFLTLSSADVDFLGWKLRWRTYTTKEVLPTTKPVELMGKKKFAAAALDPEHETYVVYIGLVSSNLSPSSSPLDIHPSWRPQISGLIAKKAPTKVSAEYLDFADVFSPDLASELPKNIEINDHAIELVEKCQQLPYGPIYSLGPVELETLKA